VVPFLRESEKGVILKVRVQTRASRNEVIGTHDQALKIRVTAAPVGGAANKHLLKLLAKRLKIPQRQMSITSGATSGTKTISIQGLSAEEVRKLLKA
jgi:uncharacterized protein (TIGR00251 family)